MDFGKLLIQLLEGTLTTVGLFAITLILSMPLGFCCSLLSLSKSRVVRSVMGVYVWIMRGSPLLLQLVFWYFGLNILGVHISRELAAVWAFVVNYTAYFSEIFRGGIQSIPLGQYEAADVLGMTRVQTMRNIVLPQVVKIVMPSVGNEVITLIKDTALVYAVGISDLLRNAMNAMTREAIITPLIVAFAFYLIMTAVLTRVLKGVERKFEYYR